MEKNESARTVHATPSGQSGMTPRCGVRAQSAERGSGQRADIPGTHPRLAAALADDAACDLHLTSIFVRRPIMPCVPPPSLPSTPSTTTRASADVGAVRTRNPPPSAPSDVLRTLPHLDPIDTHLLAMHATLAKPRPPQA
ncbi:hypothetical protein B0H14DRAFT_3152043 [Mycena olivaceomarginata]|nr:hypothetical protein B0H14DRAFT_3152043 [Mycena olivaceomarginata]